MKKTCLTCRYEPNWGKWGETKLGMCKWDKKMVLPEGWKMMKSRIVRYDDDSGIFCNCPVWEVKE